ncbi:MAG: carboxypeptidase regulatory-like domain-containing protein [Planctomycetes bacterium]|nr:carboxypeptidase regulatory-like domain-containing protein [Planctomycetota bacterium]
MTQAAKIVVPLLLLAALGGGAAYFLLQPGDSTPPPVVTPGPRPEPPAEPRPVAPEIGRTTAPDTAPVDRTQADAGRGAAHADARQGVRGRVVLPDGRPAAGVPVMLVQNVATDAATLFLLNKTTKTVTPLASSTTAEDGSFALGVRQPGKACDLRIVSDDHPERNLSQLRVREGDWYDAGEIRLEFGSVVQGRVVEEDTQLGVAGATVFLAPSHQSHAMLATPGRERGIAALTDATGFFQFTTAPAQGLINLTVEAVGYASSPVLNQPLKPKTTNEFTLQVVRGEPIAGVVVDPDGKPVAGATVTATGLSTKTPQTATAVTAGDGTFGFPSLRVGPYVLHTTMSGFLDAREPMVMTGDTAVKLVLGTRAFVKVRVLATSGSPVKNYRLSLTRYFPNNPAGVGKVLDYPDRTVNPGDYPGEFGGEWAVVRGLPTGEFRLMIEDAAHAKTLSPPFTVAEGGSPPEVTVQLTLGGTIVGRVVDDRGQPVANATVATDMNGGPAADLGFLEMFRSMMPEKHTKATARTDAQGAFRIGKLAFSDYMVRVSHPSFCEGQALNVKVEAAGQVVDTGVIELSKGALVEGRTTVAGLPAGQVEVAVSTPFQENLNQRDASGKPVQVLFNTKAISDGDGNYRLLKRVPPGKYKISASRQNAENPFYKMMDMRETERELVVVAGQDRVELDFNLSKR